MKTKIINFIKSLNKKNVTSFALALLALINQGLTLCGKSVLPIDNSTIETTISLLFTVGSSLYLAWTNFNTSEGAQKTQALLDLIKAGVVTVEEVEKFVEQSKEVKGVIPKIDK